MLEKIIYKVRHLFIRHIEVIKLHSESTRMIYLKLFTGLMKRSPHQ